MDLKEFLYLAALVVFAFGCRTFDSRLLQKTGWIAMLAATYLLGLFLTGSHAAGVVAVLAWFLIPGLQIVGRVRRMRFPMRQEVKSRFPPSRELFPALDDLTAEAHEAGYEEVEDVGWEWTGMEHFARLLYHPGRRWQMTITLDSQDGQAVSFVSLTTRLADGRSFTTSTFPFPPIMKFPPLHEVSRWTDAADLQELEQEHERFLSRRGVEGEEPAEQDTQEFARLLEREMTSQIDHNMKTGLIVAEGEDEFRYSWRGCLYLWGQVVKEMLLL